MAALSTAGAKQKSGWCACLPCIGRSRPTPASLNVREDTVQDKSVQDKSVQAKPVDRTTGGVDGADSAIPPLGSADGAERSPKRQPCLTIDTSAPCTAALDDPAATCNASSVLSHQAQEPDLSAFEAEVRDAEAAAVDVGLLTPAPHPRQFSTVPLCAACAEILRAELADDRPAARRLVVPLNSAHVYARVSTHASTTHISTHV